MSHTFTTRGDTIKGARIIGIARKISKPVLIPQSGRHKAQKIVLRDNAVCRIIKEREYVE
ncbi:MAG: hypothetical protein A4E27_01413 [Methanobacterium sp. PtaU1.Bin242]|nr:MAG: hypothetical protein A4E27_01413 [Methanobacterium sp. PtaU1.Bin242]